MKVFKKRMRDIQNITIRYGEDMYEIFTRVGVNEFERMYKSSSDWICTACGEYLNENNKDNHTQCELEHFSDEHIAQYVVDMLMDNDENVVQINEGLDDECYIALS